MPAPAEFNALYDREWSSVVRSLTLVFGRRDVAEDAAQVGFEQALRKWRRVQAMDRPGTWIYVVAVRWGRRHLAGDAAPAVGGSEVPDPADGVVDAVWVTQVLATLPPRQRAAVVLRILGGLRLREIAEALGVAEGTVKATLHAAYGRLRVEIAAGDVEEVSSHAP
jgi:DNA-directed RNA polymerase specialized sigma24 family protein